MNKKYLLRAVAFIIISLLIFSEVQKIFVAPDPTRTAVWIKEFYDEPANTMDAVIIGASFSYTLFQSPLAWHSHGITVWNYACEGQRLAEAEYMIKEARKLQPNACYIVCVNGLFGEWHENIIHYLSDFMHFSPNKLAMINRVCDLAGYDRSTRLEYVIPMIRYHDRWKELSVEDFHQQNNGMKGADVRSLFLGRYKDESMRYHPTDKKGVLSSDIKESMTRLLDYLDQNNVKAIFMVTPQLRQKEVIAQYNAALKMAEKRGYTTLNLYKHMEDMHLDLTQDYYNVAHTNIFGSMKATAFLADYFKDYLNLSDKRSDSSYVSWNYAYHKYQSEYLAPLMPESVMDMTKRDFSIEAPGEESATETQEGVLLAWGDHSDADGYYIFKKVNDDPFLFLTGADNSVHSYVDEWVNQEADYTYIIIPYRLKNGQLMYGKYKEHGVIIRK